MRLPAWGTRPNPAAAWCVYDREVERNEYGQSVGHVVSGWTPRELPGRTELVGRYVRAEPVDVVHVPALYAALCGPQDAPLWTYRPGPVPGSVEEMERLVVRLRDHPVSASYAFVPESGTAEGLATFFPCVPESGVVEISGVIFSRRMQRTPASTEAIHLMLGEAFDELGYRRVEWKCDHLNEPSGLAALRLGFTFEGRFRQHMVTHGRNRDTDWYAILDSEWPAVRARHRRWLSPDNFDSDGRQRRRMGSL